VTRRYWWWYWLLHKVTGCPVVLIRRWHGEECLRLVRYRIRFGARRPCVNLLTDTYVVSEDGQIVDDLKDLTQPPRYKDRWQLVHGMFKPSVMSPEAYS
jgi:hypothetical protein